MFCSEAGWGARPCHVPGGTDPEDAWATFILFIMTPSVSAAGRLRGDFSDSFLTALRVSGVAIYSVLLPYYRSFSPSFNEPSVSGGFMGSHLSPLGIEM